MLTPPIGFFYRAHIVHSPKDKRFTYFDLPYGGLRELEVIFCLATLGAVSDKSFNGSCIWGRKSLSLALEIVQVTPKA